MLILIISLPDNELHIIGHFYAENCHNLSDLPIAVVVELVDTLA